MRSITGVLVTFAVAAGVLLAGCSGGSSNPLSDVQGNVASRSLRSGNHGEVTISGTLSRSFSGAHVLAHAAGKTKPASRPRADRGNVYIAQTYFSGADSVNVFENGSYTYIGPFQGGGTADGEWTDVHKNLYIANYGGYVTEFSCATNKCGASSTFTYSTGLNNPIVVTTDKSGNVFVGANQGATVTEYAQGSNAVVHQCSFASTVSGVAVESTSGNVFVATHIDSHLSAQIVEFKGGLAGCSGTVLGAQIGASGGLVLDNHNNIIVCDQWNAVVDVIAPPYSGITGTIGGPWVDPYQLSLEKRGKKMLLYVSDDQGGPSGTGQIQVFGYPSGTLVASLSGGTFFYPLGVTDTFNLVR